jgi:signal transduction histidine kinase
MFLQDRIVEPLRSLLDRQGVGVALFDGEGQTVLSHGVASTAPQRGADRSMLETRLPWTVRVVSANPDVERAQFSTKRQLVIAGLVFLALFVVAGSYLSVRAMTREMEAMRLKSDFVAAVSHEFRTPLTLLRQFSDLLAEDRVSNEQERRRYYAAIQRGTRRLTRLVEDLLDFGRMEAGSRSFRFERVDVQSWFMKLTGEFEEEIRSKGYRVDVEYTCPPGLVVKADEEAIGRALWNLLDNAVKYSPTVKTIWVSAAYEDGRVILRVRDRGIGVPLEEQRQIFRKFVRGSATNTQVVKGTGLGLALVEQIVEAHSGVVRLESVAGEGSTFSISLPVEVNQQEQNTWLAS